MSFPIVFFTITATLAEAEQRLAIVEAKRWIPFYGTKIKQLSASPTQAIFKVARRENRHIPVQLEVTLTALSPTQTQVTTSFKTPLLVYMTFIHYGLALIFAIVLLMLGLTKTAIIVAMVIIIGAFLTNRSYRHEQRHLLKRIEAALTSQ